MKQPMPSGAFAAVQRRFAAHLRSPAKHPAPVGLDARRVSTYCTLFYNNVEGFMSKGFPVIRRLLSDEAWHEMIRDFYENHVCATPYFTSVGREFVTYVQQERPADTDLPFLAELAYYEWIEVEVRISREPAGWVCPATLCADPSLETLLDEAIVVSPFVRPLQFQYPVHQISPTFQPQEAPEQATFLVVYRNRQEGVSFLSANAMTVRLIQLLQERTVEQGPLTGRQALEALALEAPQAPWETLLDFGGQLLVDFKEKGIILGVVVLDRVARDFA